MPNLEASEKKQRSPCDKEFQLDEYAHKHGFLVSVTGVGSAASQYRVHSRVSARKRKRTQH